MAPTGSISRVYFMVFGYQERFVPEADLTVDTRDWHAPIGAEELRHVVAALLVAVTALPISSQEVTVAIGDDDGRAAGTASQVAEALAAFAVEHPGWAAEVEHRHHRVTR